MQEKDVRRSALEYAYLGDGVYELKVRTYLLQQGSSRIGQLHDAGVRLVSAPAQCRAARRLEGELSPEEREIFIKGRNAHPHSCPRGATHEQYAYATALEALFGWLHLQGQQARIAQLFDRCLAVLLENPEQI